MTIMMVTINLTELNRSEFEANYEISLKVPIVWTYVNTNRLCPNARIIQEMWERIRKTISNRLECSLIRKAFSKIFHRLCDRWFLNLNAWISTGCCSYHPIDRSIASITTTIDDWNSLIPRSHGKHNKKSNNMNTLH